MVLAKHELETKPRDENTLIRSGVLRDENPLDLSAEFNDFLEACRRGDLKRCQELISEAGVNINGKDTFDYTPLIVASLCGHFDLVRFLLESGAIAERNTFQGERCIYNALNDKIRKLLIDYDYSKSTDPLQSWSSHITSLLSLQTPRTADIALVSGPEDANTANFQLHKFLLAARTPYFGKKLADAPETTTWKLAGSIPSESYRVVIRYLYLGELPRDFTHGGSGATEEQIFKGIDKVSRSLEVEHLWDAVLSANDRRLARQRYQDEVQRAQTQIEKFFRDHVLKRKIVIDADKVSQVAWSADNPIFSDCLLQADEPLPEEQREAGTPTNPSTIPVGPTDSAENGQRQRRSTLYPVHKAMLIRSPYFHTMFSGPFLESQESDRLRIIKVDCTPEVLEVVLTFLYTEKADCRLDLALDLLYTADMLLLDKLKTRAAGIISALGSGSNAAAVDKVPNNASKELRSEEAEPINVYDVIRAAWDLRVQRLEEFAARYIAARLETYIDEPEFAEMIKESASRIRNREETDTIELLDDIRYYLSERFRLRFEDAWWEEMMGEDERPLGAGKQDVEERPTAPKSEWIKTLNGALVEDEFEADAANYQMLLGKIDEMLERLKLDA